MADRLKPENKEIVEITMYQKTLSKRQKKFLVLELEVMQILKN
jgi:hypothetical protein